jgi:deoxyribonuclease-4
MPRSISKLTMAQEQDILKMPAPETPPKHTSRRIGIHTSTAGGPETAAERAYRLGCNAFQIFSSSPRQWKPYTLASSQCETMGRLRQQYGLKALVIHANYLINLAGGNDDFYRKSVEAFRGEVQRAVALCAEYLVLHPGSFRGATRQDGLDRVAAGIAVAVESVPQHENLTVLIENTAGSEFSLGGSFEQVAELVEKLRPHIHVAACIDTCHTHVAGYDIVTVEGHEQSLQQLDNTVGLKNVMVWHCNDAKAERGSHLDRHQHVGQGTIGLETFRRLLNDPRLAHAAFIAETPIDQPGDDRRNIETLKSLVADGVEQKSSPRRKKA